MASQPWVTGPAHIFCGVGVGYAPRYLGTAEKSVRGQRNLEYEPVFNDIGGTRIPIDTSFQGEQWFISADVSRWDMASYNLLATVPRPSGTLGQNAGGDLGTLMIQEGCAYPLWIQFPYGGGAKVAYAGLEAGRRFFASYLLGPEVLEPMGTQPHKRRLVWHCLRLLAPAANNSIASASFDANMSGLPAIT